MKKMDIHGRKKKSKFSTFDPLTSFKLNGLLENDDLLRAQWPPLMMV